MTPFEQIRLELEKASIEEKSIIKKYLQENEPIPADIDEKTKTFICCARRFKDPVQKDQLLAAVSKPQAYTFNKNNLSQDFFISILKNTSDLSKNNIAAAIRKEDPSSLTMQDKKIYAMIIFYLSLENNKHEREGVAELLKLTTDQLDTTIEKTIKEDQLIVPVEYFQPEQPFEDQQDTLIPKIEIEKEPANALRHQKTFTISVSKQAQRIMNVTTDQMPNKIIVSPKDISLPTSIRVSLGMPDGVQTKQKLTYFDRIVEDAIGTLFEQGFHDITPEMVHRQINGQATDSSMRKETVQKIDQSIMKMASTWTKIDYTEQLRKQDRYADTAKGTVSGMLLQGARVEQKMKNGQTHTGWKIHALPMIFNYSKMISQVASLPVKILNTKTLKNSPEQTLAKYYLIAQIERIRKKPEMNKILYRKLFEITGDDAALNIKQRRATRIKMIKAILNDFTRQGYILNWTETVCGKTKDGVQITCAPKLPVEDK